MRKLTVDRFLRDNQGLETVEWLTIAAVIVTLALPVTITILTNAQGKGSGVASYIGGINAPTSPGAGP